MSFKVVKSKIAILENYPINNHSTDNPIILKLGDVLHVDLDDGDHITGKLIMFKESEDCFCLKIDTSKKYFYCCTKIIFNQEGVYVTNDDTTSISIKVKSVSINGIEIDNLETPNLFKLFKILKFYILYNDNDEFFYNLTENNIIDVSYWDDDKKLSKATTGRFECIRTVENYRGYDEHSIILDTSEDKNGSSKSIKLDNIISIRYVLPYPFGEKSHTPNSDGSCTD